MNTRRMPKTLALVWWRAPNQLRSYTGCASFSGQRVHAFLNLRELCVKDEQLVGMAREFTSTHGSAALSLGAAAV